MKILYSLIAIILCNSVGFSIQNNHGNVYDPNTIYTSTQYLIDNNPELIKDEKHVMQLNKDLLNIKSQNSINFSFIINCKISNTLQKKNNVLSINDFREIIDPIIDSNIGNLPKDANEISILNCILTKLTLNLLLNNIIKDNTTTQHDLFLSNNLNDSIFGTKYSSNIKWFDDIKYKNKTCKFRIEKKHAKFHYIVKLS